MDVTDGHLRASDAERDEVIEVLRQHAADGRLTLAEFEERVGEALAATTRADLAPVLRDLPELEPQTTPSVRTRRPTVPAPSLRTVWTAVAVVLAVVLLAQGAWWIVFPLMGVLGGCGRRGTCATRRNAHDSAWRTRPTSSEAERDLIRV